MAAVVVHVHAGSASTFEVRKHNGSQWLDIKGDGHSGAAVFGCDTTLTRLRDAIDAHLGERPSLDADKLAEVHAASGVTAEEF